MHVGKGKIKCGAHCSDCLLGSNGINHSKHDKCFGSRKTEDVGGVGMLVR